MTLLLEHSIDLSPAVFGDPHDQITVRVTLVESLELASLLEAGTRETEPRPTHVLACMEALDSAQAQATLDLRRGDGARLVVLEIGPANAGVEQLVRSLFPAVQALMLSLRQDDVLQIYWPMSHGLTALHQAVRRALRWRGAWCDLDEADGITRPPHLA